jgi:HlyD family secretion protein
MTTTHLCPSIDQWHRNVPSSGRLPTLIGIAVLVLCLGGFGVWATLAPLDGAVVVSGSFVATGQNKQVQHLEGGIIRDVLVKEGDLVEANQPLVRLDDTASRAKLRRLVLRKYRLLIMKARLEAETTGAEKFDLPPALAAEATDPEVRSIIDRQLIELAARRAKLFSEEEVLRKEIAGLKESITGYQAQVRSNESRLALFSEELKDRNALLARQLARKTEVLAVQRAEVALSGELGELTARIGDAKQRIARAEQQIMQIRSSAMQKAIEELRATETELDDITEQARAAQDVVDRVEVRAPVRGVVVKLNQHTQGGVVGAGAVILELLPVNDELIIEARLNPSEITHVHAGQDALVRLSAYNQRVTPMIQGKVIYVSADTIAHVDPRSKVDPDSLRRDSFVLRVRLDKDDAAHQIPHFRLTPGMPVDVFVKTGERTFFSYIMRPIADSFSRAFREQ